VDRCNKQTHKLPATLLRCRVRIWAPPRDRRSHNIGSTKPSNTHSQLSQFYNNCNYKNVQYTWARWLGWVPKPHYATYIVSLVQSNKSQKKIMSHTILIRCLQNKKFENKNDQSNKNKLLHHFSLVIRVVKTQERKKERSLGIITIPIPQNTPNIQIYPLQNNIYVSKVHCGSAFGPSWLPYYCTPPVCFPAVIGALAVRRQITNKEKVIVVSVWIVWFTWQVSLNWQTWFQTRRPHTTSQGAGWGSGHPTLFKGAQGEEGCRRSWIVGVSPFLARDEAPVL